MTDKDPTHTGRQTDKQSARGNKGERQKKDVTKSHEHLHFVFILFKSTRLQILQNITTKKRSNGQAFHIHNAMNRPSPSSP